MDFEDRPWLSLQEERKMDALVNEARRAFRHILEPLQAQYPNLVFKIHKFLGGVSLIVRQPSGANVARITYEYKDNEHTFNITGHPPKRVTFDQAVNLLEEALATLS